MSAFDSCFIFLDNPRGGVENLNDMKAAGFAGIFCNVIDYPYEAWEEIIRPRAHANGMVCGPWGRTGHPPPQGVGFEEARLDRIILVADRWQAPLIINSEKEIDGSGDAVTDLIAKKVGKREAAISSEAWLYPSVDWRSVAHLPMLLQIFPTESEAANRPADCKWHAHDEGLECVYLTFGTYGGMKPADFDLKAPFSLYTGDAMAAVYPPWSPTSSGFQACQEVTPVPDIGSQDGIRAAVNRLRADDPGGTLAPEGVPKGADLAEYLGKPVDQWKAYDKLERTLQILKDDHDAAI